MEFTRNNRSTGAEGLSCPFCNASGKALVGPEDEQRRRRMKCRKCDAEYWENQATGLVQLEEDESGRHLME